MFLINKTVFHKQNIPYQEAPLLNCGGAFTMQRGNIWNFIRIKTSQLCVRTAISF